MVSRSCKKMFFFEVSGKSGGNLEPILAIEKEMLQVGMM